MQRTGIWRTGLAAAAFCLLAAGCGGDAATTTTMAAPTTTTAAPATTTTAAPTTSTVAPATTTTAAPATTTTVAPLPIALGIAIAEGVPEATQSGLAAGADRAMADFGTEVGYSWVEDGPVPALEELAAVSDVVLAVGFGFEDAVAEVAPRFPDVVFVRLDGTVEGENVVSTRIAMNEAAYLAGAAAALTSGTGKVALMGAMPIPGVTTLEAGFTAGAREANPDVEVTIRYLGEPGQWEVFNDEILGWNTANELYGEGNDVIMNAAGAAGAGLFEAAGDLRGEGSDVWAIGVDFDQAEGIKEASAEAILTSAIRTFDGALYWVAQQAAAGMLPVGGAADLGLAEGSVALTETGGFLEGILTDLEALTQRIIDGDIEVPEQP